MHFWKEMNSSFTPIMTWYNIPNSFWYWSLNSGLCNCKTGTLQLESYLQHFCSGYFGGRVSLFIQTSLDHDPPIWHFLQLLEWQVLIAIHSFFPLRWDLINFFFCLGWSEIAIFLTSASHVSWNERCMLVHPVIGWDRFLLIPCCRWPWTSILLISTSQVAPGSNSSFNQRIKDLYCAIFRMGIKSLSQIISRFKVRRILKWYRIE
jgi:hypothetical protein